MATLAHKISPAQARRITEALTRPSYELSPETPTVTWRALITHGLAYHGQLRERVTDERGHLVRSHGVMLTDEGVKEAKRLAGESTITREDVARAAEDAIQWVPRNAREEWAAKPAAEVLAREVKRARQVWRRLAQEGGRIPVETQALEHFTRVQELADAARRFEQEDMTQEGESTPQGAEDGRAVGFYVYVRHGKQRGFLLGPYATKGEADANVSRARQHADEHVPGSGFYEYGSARAVAKPGRTLPVGKFNDRIGLVAEEGETVTNEESTPVERVKHRKTAAGVLESLRTPGIGHGDEGDRDDEEAAHAAAVADGVETWDPMTEEAEERAKRAQERTGVVSAYRLAEGGGYDRTPALEVDGGEVYRLVPFAPGGVVVEPGHVMAYNVHIGVTQPTERYAVGTLAGERVAWREDGHTWAQRGKYMIRTEQRGTGAVAVYVKGPGSEVDSIDRAADMYARRALGVSGGPVSGGGEGADAGATWIAQRIYSTRPATPRED